MINDIIDTDYLGTHFNPKALTHPCPPMLLSPCLIPALGHPSRCTYHFKDRRPWKHVTQHSAMKPPLNKSHTLLLLPNLFSPNTNRQLVTLGTWRVPGKRDTTSWERTNHMKGQKRLCVLKAIVNHWPFQTSPSKISSHLAPSLRPQRRRVCSPGGRGEGRAFSAIPPMLSSNAHCFLMWWPWTCWSVMS